MTRKDDVSQNANGVMSAERREPSLADLEAFERLLRDSLKADAVPAAAPQAAPPVAPPISAQSAMAEFNRLIETPVSFDTPGQPATSAQISAIERALQHDIAGRAAPQPPLPPDPLLDFEEELRRFEALSRPAINPNPVEPVDDLRPAYAGEASQPLASEAHWSQPMSTPEAWQGYQEAPAPANHSDALDAAERRLSAEAEAGAVAGGAALAAGAAAGASKGRSRSVFYALGGVAVAGLAVVGGMAMFSGKGPVAGGGNVPVIAAKTEPTKEKPANPGGLEVPDQNKQVLAPRATPADPRAQQVVNQTEQPVDLNQVARRDSVRIIAPSPFQPGSGTTPPAETTAQPNQPAAPVAGEPRRVQSVRLSDPVTPTAQPTPVLPPAGSAAPGAAAIGAIAAGAASVPNRVVPGVTPGAQAAIRPQAPQATPPAAAPPVATAPAPTPVPPPPKVEARPQSPVVAPRPAQPAQNAPLPLNNRAAAPAPAPAPQRTANAPAAGAGGGFAIQLASRPSESDARNASTQLAQRFASQIGGRQTAVVRGEANGQTVYRVRALGFSQSDANAACDRIRASGGACFVTRQ
ncbi:MAG: SPOR domain-containing protein [Rhizobiales bacterium]|nr:SPOR domain-containing protein [Hyphomicrobiales bacterium]